MSRRPNHPLRSLSEQEHQGLLAISRSYTEPAAHLARAKAPLAVAEGCSFSEAARRAGRKSGDALGQLVARFNLFGLSALETRHGGGRQPIYLEQERQRILQAFERTPDREADGTATWSLSLLRDALRKAPDGRPALSTSTISAVLHEARVARGRLYVAEGSLLVPHGRGHRQAQGGGCARDGSR